MTTRVEKSILVNVPVSTAYNQWTQFEDFPQFMGGVQSVTQLDDRRVRGLDDVYAAGDITNFPVKQGGIATQLADAAAEAIAARPPAGPPEDRRGCGGLLVGSGGVRCPRVSCDGGG